MTTAPITLRSVLIIAIGNAEHLKPGIPVPERGLNRQIDTAFAGTARSKVYWIESIGPHWRYGEKEDDGQDVQPLMTKTIPNSNGSRCCSLVSCLQPTVNSTVPCTEINHSLVKARYIFPEPRARANNPALTEVSPPAYRVI